MSLWGGGGEKDTQAWLMTPPALTPQTHVEVNSQSVFDYLRTNPQSPSFVSHVASLRKLP